MTDVYGPSTIKRARRTRDELSTLDQAIITAVEVEAPATLRGIYYRVVSAGAIDKTELAYKTVGRRLVGLRQAGRVSYSDITDGTRWIIRPTTYNSKEEALQQTARLYRRRLWTDSPYALQLYTEKDAISGVVLPVTDFWDLPLGVLRGYVSESFAWRVGQSMSPYKLNVVAQLGDHDPSGVGAWENFCTKVEGFAPDARISFERIAVTPEQIEAMQLPTRPTKRSDPRAKGFAGESVEVDAIPPSVLRSLVQAWVLEHVDDREVEQTLIAEESERDVLRRMAGIAEDIQ